LKIPKKEVKAMCKKESYIVSAVIVLAAVVMLLFPMTGLAGDLEPGAAPASTMKTLDQIPPTWGQKLPGAQRFELVLDGAAVLDKETGLVWEQSPNLPMQDWPSAQITCAQKAVGGRKGWHLPTIEQLASLVDTSASGIYKLPPGHLFDTDCSSGNCVQSGYYWSATTCAFNTAVAWDVDFSNGYVNGGAKTGNASNPYVWCVRGGQSYDAY
jgi:hypothetical protein